MTETIQIHFGHPIPVFPLPGCVLLPHAALPLHIYEERYRSMVHDVLDSHGLIAMGLFESAVTQREYERGRPPIRSHVCVGYVEQYRKMDDGRYLMVLRGLCRAKVIREESHEPYRKFLLQPTDVDQDSDDRLGEHRDDLERLLADPHLRKMEGVDALGGLIDEPIPTTALIDIVTMHMCDDPELRYPMLVEQCPVRRGDRLTAFLEELRRKQCAVGE